MNVGNQMKKQTNMKKSVYSDKENVGLRILYLEDSDLEAKRVCDAIRSDEIEFKIEQVKNKEEFVQAVKKREFDIVLAEASLPDFDGVAALDLVQQEELHTPFIFLAEDLEEDQAIESIKKGASDYVIKNQLSRLMPSIYRALRELEEEEGKKRTEEQLFQSQKLGSIGQLAGGVAHDFNNQLTVIIGFADILLDMIEETDPMYAYLDEIKKASDRSAQLTSQLLSFTRKQMGQKESVNPNKLILNMHGMFKRIVGENIDFQTLANDEVGIVHVDPFQIEHVLTNLVVNARDVMPDGGRLTIETVNIALDDEYVKSHPYAKPGEYVMITVSDTGSGIPEKVKERLFEPFFTTKENGKGTGLGLATSLAVIKQNGGHIGVYSEEGLGTTFKLYLPVADSEPVKDQKEDENVIEQADECVLLVEDEESVRNIVSTMLQMKGYTVISAKNGRDAIRRVEEKKESGVYIRLLLTDIVMPHMTGAELAEKVRSISPKVQVLFMSGYTDAYVKKEMVGEGSHFIQKPLSAKALNSKLREILDIVV